MMIVEVAGTEVENGQREGEGGLRYHVSPHCTRVTEGRSLPGDSTLVCAAYHQFPLILNRIQRTNQPSRRPPPPACVHTKVEPATNTLAGQIVCNMA